MIKVDSDTISSWTQKGACRRRCCLSELEYSNLPAFEEGDVDGRGVEVDKLEDENFQDEHVLIFGLCPVHFYRETGGQAGRQRKTGRHSLRCCSEGGQDEVQG